ncbi:MAG: MBL fold metallo-hydrolase, partial [Pseudomonadota bacterium]
LVASGKELLLVDGGLAAQSRDLLRLVAAEHRSSRIQTAFNTHWHWAHTGSNEALRAQGVDILAHENTRLWLKADVNSAWEGRIYPASKPAALPNQTFFHGSKSVDFGGEAVEYGLLPQAHTDGDIYVFLPKQNVLVAGDVATSGSYPVLDYSTNGWLGGMVAGLKTLLTKGDADTRIVPGSGAVRSRADLKAQQDMCFTVLQRIGESYYKGQTWDEFLASKPTREFDAAWGNPEVFLRNAWKGAWEHINEIRRVTR